MICIRKSGKDHRSGVRFPSGGRETGRGGHLYFAADGRISLGMLTSKNEQVGRGWQGNYRGRQHVMELSDADELTPLIPEGLLNSVR